MKKFDLHNDTKITTGFKTPEHYFDSIEDRVMQKISFEENKISTGFKIPENYFVTFEEKIMQQLPIEKEVKVFSIWQQKSLWISGIAAVLLISLGTIFYFNQPVEENFGSSSEYLAYENDVTSEDIALQLTDDDITALETELNTLDTESATYINDYLN